MDPIVDPDGSHVDPDGSHCGSLDGSMVDPMVDPDGSHGGSLDGS